MAHTARPIPWDTDEVKEARRNVLSWCNEENRADVERKLEIRALARDARAAGRLENVLKGQIKKSRGGDAALRARRQALADLRSTLVARMRELEYPTMTFPGGQTVDFADSTHAHSEWRLGGDAGDYSEELDRIFPPLL